MGCIRALNAQGFLCELLSSLPDDELFSPETVFVFPTRRAGLYFRHYLFQKRQKAGFLPRIVGFADLIQELSSALDPSPLLPRADQAWLLWEIVRHRTPFARVASSFDRFFPWGLRLAEVLDQLERELVEAQNIVYPPEEELPHEARLFLEHLGEIQRDFRQKLKERQLTTPGIRLRLLATEKEKLTFPHGPLHLVGFFMLTRAEQELFKYWLQKGATLWWRLEGDEFPEVYRRLEKIFGLKAERKKTKTPRPTFHFFEAPDVHHELSKLRELLPRKIKSPDETLILLCAAGHLIPLLYELPEDITVNITLGYPLFRTPLAQLFLLFTEVVESSHEEEVYIPAYLKLLKHPYLRGLTFEGEVASVFFRDLENRLRDHGSPFLTLKQIETLFEGEKEAFYLRAQKFLSWFHKKLLFPWLHLKTTQELAWCLRRLVKECTRGRPLQKENAETLLERAFIYAFETEVLPSLENVSFASEKLAPKTIFIFLKELLRNIRAPFEGEPLEGLQIMGLLETRLLSFRQIFVLDANEGYLPSVEEVNPLLPEGIKPLLGLPPREREEIIEKHHFLALVSGAKEVFIFFQSAISGKGESAGKKLRSRYVERLLWEEEKACGKLLPEKISFIPLKINPKAFKRREAIPKGQAEKEAVLKLLTNCETGISATFINTYLACPAKFYFHYLLGLRPTKEVAEFDAAELGNIVHAALEEYFRPFLGNTYLPLEDNNSEKLLGLFDEFFKLSSLYHRLGPERRFFVEETARFRLKRYLDFLARHHVTGFEIISLEKEYRRKFQDLLFIGRIDRLERREERLYVLDYKTGTFVKTYSAKHLEEKLFAFDPPLKFGAEEFLELRERIPDIQLFLYLFLTTEEGTQNAAYLQLAAGKFKDLEKPLFYEKYLALEKTEEFMALRFPRLLEYILRHMVEAEAFYATPEEKLCSFCDFRLACECAKKY